MNTRNSAPASSEKQIENPLIVSITYRPEKQLAVIGQGAQAAIARMNGAPKITGIKTLDAACEILHDAETALASIGVVRDAFADRVKHAFDPFRATELFEGGQINITLTIPLRTKLENGIRAMKADRARYLDEERRRMEREQQEAEAKQRKINEDAAKEAAKAAKKAGADAETVAEIKREVLSTPAPLVESNTLNRAKSAGASVRYKYYARIIDLRKFLTAVLANGVLFNTLKGAEVEIEGAFHNMAQDQKEAFKYPGIVCDKVAVDVQR